MFTAQWSVAGVGAVLTGLWWCGRGRRVGLLGPPPDRPFPDLTKPLCVAVVVYLLLVPVLAGAVIARLGWVGDDHRGPALFVFAVCSLLVGIGFLRFARRVGPPTVSSGRLAVAGLVGGLGAYAATSLIGLAIIWGYGTAGRPTPEQSAIGLLRGSSAVDLTLLTVAVVGIAPFVEEVLYRGLLLPTLARGMTFRGANLAQASLFGLAHVWRNPENLALAVPLAAVGWIAGALYGRTRSLLGPIVLHGTFNAINVAFLLMQPRG